ncbi:MAG: 50S ribosomal protein L21 [Pseudomonadota bacterium]|uniref:50S ribosomal protein L21 n=1 Tax=Thermithiobacillus tepidarius TaxID=929 RepID=UPI0003F64B8E|nr:50S ribosomal protein L21 [Thermithiobacillus tepidarius]
MYAVIETGGKQYKVAVGDSLRVEKLDGEEGSEVTLSRVLMVGNGENVQVGKPLLDGAKVTAVVAAQGRGEKIRIFKMRRRKHYRKSQGHRQYFTELKITGINA